MLWFILYFRLKGKGSASRTECQIYRVISVCPVIVIESAKMEKLMQYIWNHRLFGSAGLTTSDGKRLQVLDPGRLNTDAGPDFFNAKISIDGCMWAGNVEIHRRSSDWRRHNHHMDPAYDSVILHVVEEDDEPVLRSDGEPIPVFLLRCVPDFYKDYEYLVSRAGTLPCADRVYELDPLFLTDWVQSLALERLQGKSERIGEWLERYTGDWEEVCFVSLARTLGFGVNGDAFERTARSLPLLFLRKHADSLFQIEAFIFGQAGLLRHGDYPDDDYYTRLTREYAFLQNKFGLKPVEAGVWRFARMRPANFPHRRLALLAQFVYEGFNLFSKIVESGDDEAIRALFSVELSGYWQTHYTFGNSVPSAPTVLGEGAIDGIMINTVAPLFYAYGMRKGGEPYIDRALSLLENLKPERNSIVRQFVDARIAVKNALDSQAVIQLHNEYCLNKKCLYCRIGHRLLSQAAVRQ